MIDAVRDGLANFGNHTGNLGKILPHFFHHGVVRPAELARYDFDLAGIDSGGMLVQFGAPGPARCRDDFGRAVQRFFDNSPNPVGLLQGGSRRQRDVDIEGALVEGRQKFTAHQRKNH